MDAATEVKEKPAKTLAYSYDEETDTLTVEGLRFSGDFFRFFKPEAHGRLFRIKQIVDGTVVLHSYPPHAQVMK